MSLNIIWWIAIPVLILAVVFLIRYFKDGFHDRKLINIDSLLVEEDWVQRVFNNYAIHMMRSEYNKQGKPTHTQQGKYRASFINDVNKLKTKVINDCCDGEYFSDDFCNFTHETHPKARARELFSIIFDFMDDRKSRIDEDFESFLQETEAVTPDEFFLIKSMQDGDKVGAYVIHNETKDMYYVGQAKRLFHRINQHLTGHGNGDVYADYKYGDDFSIKIVTLADSGYSDLDLLEKDLIDLYDACENGYNRTVGNS